MQVNRFVMRTALEVNLKIQPKVISNSNPKTFDPTHLVFCFRLVFCFKIFKHVRLSPSLLLQRLCTMENVLFKQRHCLLRLQNLFGPRSYDPTVSHARVEFQKESTSSWTIQGVFDNIYLVGCLLVRSHSKTINVSNWDWCLSQFWGWQKNESASLSQFCIFLR